MIYQSADDWRSTRSKRVLLFGMSGLGKTHISNMLRQEGNWFHYSVDYRIGTRYLGEHIDDNLKREAMKNPFLRGLLKTDSIYIGSNITFEDLSPLSTFLGKPGNPDKGGMDIAEYRRRQDLHHEAEVAALRDTPYFIKRAQDLYGYDNFVCDSGGSICEVVDPEDPNDALLATLSKHVLMVWIKGDSAHNEELARRFSRSPKPMCYQRDFLARVWQDFLEKHGGDAQTVDPDEFVRHAYNRALAHREPRYAAMARNWGISVDAKDVSRVSNAQEFDALIARALEDHAA